MSFSYSTKALPDGSHLLYSDSGPVTDSTDYNTLVIIHGSGYNGYGFERMHTAGLKQNIRTIVVNRPEYAGSSKYTDEQIKQAAEGQKSFLDLFQLRLANFLHFVVEELQVPRYNESKNYGGISVMGWSFGVLFQLSLLGDPTVIPKDIYNVIEPEIRNMILYDPPYLSFGFHLPETFKAFDPWKQPDQSVAEMYADFSIWVSSYYDHKNTDSLNIEDFDTRSRGEACSLDNMTREDIDRAFDAVAPVRADFPLMGPKMQSTVLEQTQRALLDRKLASSHFPNVKISYVLGMRTQWHGIIGRNILKKELAKAIGARSIRFTEIAGGNHFLHYDAVESLVTAIAQLIS